MVNSGRGGFFNSPLRVGLPEEERPTLKEWCFLSRRLAMLIKGGTYNLLQRWPISNEGGISNNPSSPAFDPKDALP